MVAKSKRSILANPLSPRERDDSVMSSTTPKSPMAKSVGRSKGINSAGSVSSKKSKSKAASVSGQKKRSSTKSTTSASSISGRSKSTSKTCRSTSLKKTSTSSGKSVTSGMIKKKTGKGVPPKSPRPSPFPLTSSRRSPSSSASRSISRSASRSASRSKDKPPKVPHKLMPSPSTGSTQSKSEDRYAVNIKPSDLSKSEHVPAQTDVCNPPNVENAEINITNLSEGLVDEGSQCRNDANNQTEYAISPSVDSAEQLKTEYAIKSPTYSNDSFEHSNYTFVTENGTEYDIDNDVNFAHFLMEAHGELVDAAKNNVPSGRDIITMFKKMDNAIPQSVKDNVNHTAHVLDPTDISGKELLASAKELSAATKVVVVEETASCATWSWSNLMSGCSLAWDAFEEKREEARKAKEEEEAQAAAAAAAENAAEAARIYTEAMQTQEVEETQSYPENMTDFADPSMQTDTYSPQHQQPLFDELTQTIVDIENMPLPPSTYFKQQMSEDVEEVEEVGDFNHYHEAVEEKQYQDIENMDRNEVRANDDESNGQEISVDMVAAMRQIEELNTQIQKLQDSSAPENVELVKVLRKKSKVLCKDMLWQSTVAAKRSKKVAMVTGKRVGQASSAFAKTSKKGLGSALLSTSKAMGSLGEKLAKADKNNNLPNVDSESKFFNRYPEM